MNGGVDLVVEVLDIVEGSVGKVVGLEVAPDGLNDVEFGRVSGQPLDAQPVSAGRHGRAREFARVDGAVVQNQHDGRGVAPWLRSVEEVQLFEMREKSLLRLVLDV